MSFRYWMTIDSLQKRYIRKICSVHRLPKASDVRMTTSVRFGTSAIALHTEMWREWCFPPFFCVNKNTINTALHTSGKNVEDKADCIVGVYSYWMYNSNWIVCVNCYWVFTALNCGYIIRHTLWVFRETTTATLALVCERMESVFCTVGLLILVVFDLHYP